MKFQPPSKRGWSSDRVHCRRPWWVQGFNPLQNGDGLPTEESIPRTVEVGVVSTPFKTGMVFRRRFWPRRPRDGTVWFQPPSKRGWSSDDNVRYCPLIKNAEGFNPLQNGDGLPTGLQARVRELQRRVSTPFKTGMVFRRCFGLFVMSLGGRFNPLQNGDGLPTLQIPDARLIAAGFQPPSKRGWSSD